MNKKIFTLSLASLLSCAALVGCSNGKEEVTESELLARLVLDSEYEAPGMGYDLPSELIDKNGDSYAISWSEDSDVIEIIEEDAEDEEGNKIKVKKVVVTHPDKGSENVNYKITGSIKFGDKTLSKDFEGIVVAKMYDTFTTKKDMLEKYAASQLISDQTIEFTGIVAHVIKGGLYLVDTNGDVLYYHGSEKGLKVGDKVTTVSKFALHFGAPQLTSGTFKKVSKDNEVALPYYKETAIGASEITSLSKDAQIAEFGKKMKVTGVCHKFDEYGKERIEIQDFAHPTHSFKFDKYNTTEEVLAKFAALDGKMVTFDAVLYGGTSSPKAMAIVYADKEDSTCDAKALTEQESFTFATNFYEAPKVIASKLPTEVKINDVTYTATYKGLDANDEELIHADGSFDSLPTELIVLKTFEVKLSKDDKSSTITFNDEVKFGIDKYSVAKEVLVAKDTDAIVFLKATVVEKIAGGTYLVTDGNNYFAFYNKSAELADGANIVVSGTYSNYNGLDQIKGDVISSEPSTEVVDLNYNNAKEINVSAFKEAKQANIKDKYTSEFSKDLYANEYSLIKFTCSLKSGTSKGQPTLYLSATGASKLFPEYSDETLALQSYGFELGTKETQVTVYGVLCGSNSSKDNKISTSKVIITKVEKVKADA